MTTSKIIIQLKDENGEKTGERVFLFKDRSSMDMTAIFNRVSSVLLQETRK